MPCWSGGRGYRRGLAGNSLPDAHERGGRMGEPITLREIQLEEISKIDFLLNELARAVERGEVHHASYDLMAPRYLARRAELVAIITGQPAPAATEIERPAEVPALTPLVTEANAPESLGGPLDEAEWPEPAVPARTPPEIGAPREAGTRRQTRAVDDDPDVPRRFPRGRCLCNLRGSDLGHLLGTGETCGTRRGDRRVLRRERSRQLPPAPSNGRCHSRDRIGGHAPVRLLDRDRRLRPRGSVALGCGAPGLLGGVLGHRGAPWRRHLRGRGRGCTTRLVVDVHLRARTHGAVADGRYRLGRSSVDVRRCPCAR